MSLLLWAVAVVLGASLVLQAVLLRNAYRRKVLAQQAKHLQIQQAMNGRLEQTKRQIGQLQNDLAAARRQLKQLGKSSPAPTPAQASASARETLERELKDSPASQHSELVDGFAETQPAPQQFTLHGSLLLQ